MSDNNKAQEDVRKKGGEPMEKSDIFVCGFMYAVCVFFLVMALRLDEGARIYPICLIAVLAALTSLQTFNMFRAAKKSGVVSGMEGFKSFLPKQFFVILTMIIIYLIVMYVAGFYIATLLFMVSALLFLRVSKVQLVIATGVVIAIAYFAFTLFLGVRLPTGILFS